MESETLSGTRQIINFIIDDWKLLLFLTIIFALYFHYTSTFDHFQKRGVKFMKPRIFVGNIGKRIIGTQSFLDFQLDVYHQFKGCRYAGVFEGRRPLLYLLDPELIKAVTIRDFDNFMDRSMFNFKEPRYLSRSLLRLKGSVWKEVRSTLTPTFSSARLKHMLPLIELCSKQMVDYLQKFDGKDVEMKETMGHFTLEVIGASAFGIKSDALSDEKSHFVKNEHILSDRTSANQQRLLCILPRWWRHFTTQLQMAEKLFIMPVSTRIVIYFSLMFYPPLMRFFNISFINKEATTTLIQMLKDTKAERKQSGQKKNDFLQLLIDAGEKERSEVEKGKEVQLDDDTIDAQSLLFLMAGYETSSTLLSFAIHILATKPEIQKKLREHIKEKTEGKEMSYDLLSELTYLEGFLLETLRVYPPVARLERMCTKNYVLPGTNLEVKKGEMIAIPVIGIHMDPEIYEDPTEFKPERFIGDAKREIPPHLYLAFGSGPRNCIGLRFAMYSAKTAMVHLLKNFEFQVCPKTEDPVKIHKRAVLLKAESGIWIKLNKL